MAQRRFLRLLIFKKLFERFEGIVADAMLDLAGVFFGCFVGNTDFFKESGEDGVALVGFLGNEKAAFGQRQTAVFISRDEATVFQKGNGAAYARLGIAHFGADVHRTHTGIFLRE